MQREAEALVIEERQVAVALCDRGTVDELAYWPDPVSTFWEEVGSTLEAELGRYHAVIHLRTPAPDQGYHTGPIRNEPAERAAKLDRRISEAWEPSPPPPGRSRNRLHGQGRPGPRADQIRACCPSHIGS